MIRANTTRQPWVLAGVSTDTPRESFSGVRALEKAEKRKEWNSAHVCPRCGFPIDLEEIGLRGGTTGFVTCPKCDWSGPIEIQIVSKSATD